MIICLLRAEIPLRYPLLNPLSRGEARVFARSARRVSPRLLRLGLLLVAPFGFKMGVERGRGRGPVGSPIHLVPHVRSLAQKPARVESAIALKTVIVIFQESSRPCLGPGESSGSNSAEGNSQ
jgi:hypothetical protein